MWKTEQHRCALPYRCAVVYKDRLGEIFECDDCKREWMVIAVSVSTPHYCDLTFELLKDKGGRVIRTGR
jgi:hypothetical protein